MSRVSELEFYNNKDVIQQIQWLKDHINGSTILDIQLEQDSDPQSEHYGRVTMTVIMEDGTSYERYFDNTAVKSITSRQEGDTVIITFHLSNGETYEVSCEIHVTATASWSSLTGQPSDNEDLTDRINELGDAKYATGADLTAEVSARAAADAELGIRVDGVESEIEELGPQIAAKGVIINGTHTIPAGMWVAGGSEEYPYFSGIPVTGLTVNDFPTVAFSETDVLSGMFSPVCDIDAGGIVVYAKEKIYTPVTVTYTVSIMGH